MDKRSWPWKKKSSSKAAASNSAAESLSSSGGNAAVDQTSTKSVDYVQISTESYAHLTGLEGQVKDLKEKLSYSKSEINTKDDLVKQHAKVAEEAVSGWETAEAEALALKNQLESVTLLKLTADEQAAHLDGALKECMKQIRIVKEESEQKLHDVVFAKTKQWEKLKSELDGKIIDFDQELLRASAENAALSRTLQERMDMLVKVSDEKSQADTEIEMLKSNLQSCEREINSLKYEIHVISKELEIRNEEKNMSMRSAEVANKQHIEDVKKIAKLEAECQRLRGLVRKKLPGPAALAQMKLEVESLGRDHGEPRVRPSSARGSRPHLDPVRDFAFENFQQCRKENEFLTARLLAMEEETKMLKEALTNRNSELLASRNMCANLRSVKEHMQDLDQQNNPSKPNIGIPIEGSLKEGNLPSLTSMSEDGTDEDGHCSESWATASVSEILQVKQATDIDKAKKADNPHSLDLMDDFLEMERLACLSTETDRTITLTNNGIDKITNENSDAIQTTQKDGGEEQPIKFVTSSTELARNLTSNGTHMSLSKLQARIASMFESQPKGSDLNKILEEIRQIVNDAQDLPLYSISCFSEMNHTVDSTIDEKLYPKDNTADNGMSLNQTSTSFVDAKNATDREVKIAISQIHDFVLSFRKEAIEIQGRHSEDHELNEKFKTFAECVNKVLSQEIVLDGFIIVLSRILSESSELRVNLLRNSHNGRESCSSDYIDKVTLLEKKVAQHGPVKERLSGASLDSHSPSDLEIKGPMDHGFDQMATVNKCTLGELEQFKQEKKNMEMELARCTESLEHTKIQLVETEQLLSELKLELAACQESNSLAETQLKCMTESYKLLESRTQELETEINLLRVKAESLENELQQEKGCHEDDLAKYKELQEKMERSGKWKCATCSISSDADPDDKMKQERGIAAAAEKLAECQETIFLLSKQLKAMRPQAELINSSPNDKQQISDRFFEDEPRRSCFGSEIEKVSVKIEGESPSNEYNSNMSPTYTESSTCLKSPINSKRQKQRSRSSSSPSLASMMTPEKHRRGFGRFFSKGKSNC